MKTFFPLFSIILCSHLYAQADMINENFVDNQDDEENSFAISFTSASTKCIGSYFTSSKTLFIMSSGCTYTDQGSPRPATCIQSGNFLSVSGAGFSMSGYFLNNCKNLSLNNILYVR